MSAIGKISVLPHQIDLWCCFTDSISDDDLHLYRQSLLSPEERERASRFYFERDRKKFVITRALVRSVLSRYAALAPAAWEFVAGSHGRPQVVQDVAQHLCFNLSHTAGLVVMAVSAAQDMGVDTENIAIRTAPLDVANSFFSPDEVAGLNAQPFAQRQQRFFEYWTLKESWIKARSMGLSIPLDQFSMDLGTEGRVSLQTQLVAQPSAWQFFLLSMGNDHLLSVCAQQEQPLHLRVHHCRPLLDETMLRATPLRQTRIEASICADSPFS
ncbi:phosphopantetheinyl transferase [Herbaspirillum lusitanum]|nr:phosphopantetheinyl transferase [Herbaspirillum lusitanum]